MCQSKLTLVFGRRSLMGCFGLHTLPLLLVEFVVWSCLTVGPLKGGGDAGVPSLANVHAHLVVESQIDSQ